MAPGMTLMPNCPVQPIGGSSSSFWRMRLADAVTDSEVVVLGTEHLTEVSTALTDDHVVVLTSAAAGATLNGRVGPDGTVGLNVSNGTASGAVSGRLQAQSGGGTWKVSSLCSGRWTARRHTTRTAQAE